MRINKDNKRRILMKSKVMVKERKTCEGLTLRVL